MNCGPLLPIFSLLFYMFRPEPSYDRQTYVLTESHGRPQTFFQVGGKNTQKDTIFVKKVQKTYYFGEPGGQGPPLALPCGRPCWKPSKFINPWVLCICLNELFWVNGPIIIFPCFIMYCYDVQWTPLNVTALELSIFEW
jgi:hypothetical protein